MTLAPTENRRVRAVPSERYPLNQFCSWPTSDPKTPATEPHHIFRRSAIGGDSWFVEITDEDGQIALPTPHVTGLSHDVHSDLTEHRKWIKLEDGIFNAYERNKNVCRDCLDSDGLNGGEVVACECDEFRDEWELVGPLNPQPGSVEGKPKRARHKGEAKRQRKTISIRVPEGSDAETYDLLMEQGREILTRELGIENPYPYLVILAGIQQLVESAGVEHSL